MQEIIKRFEEAINELKCEFNSQSDGYFFTEKELHSFFYSICLKKQLSFEDYNLIHTEYPTPFKCETLDKDPFIKEANSESDHRRAHIDLVLINPDFIKFTKLNEPNNYHKYISGIGGVDNIFLKYIKEHFELFNKFAAQYKQSVLLYALEFKYLRHNFIGENDSEKNILQDINKLKLLKNKKIGMDIDYCSKIKSLVFIGENVTTKVKTKLQAIESLESDICVIVEKKNPTTAST